MRKEIESQFAKVCLYMHRMERGKTKNLTFVLHDITWLDRDNERGRKEREKVRAEVGRE